MENFLIAARAVHYASTISLAGVFAFLCLVAAPAPWPRLRRRHWLIAWASLAVAMLSGAAWLLFGSAQMSGQPIADTLTQGVIGIVLSQTRFGQIWVLRFVIGAVLAGLLLVPQRWHNWMWRWGGLVLSAGALASLAWAGHGAATPGRPGDLHLAADILHLLAAGAWVGSLVPFALLLAEAGRSGDPAAAATVRRVVVRYSVLAAISVTILFTAGLVNTWFLAGSVPALLGTAYGRLVLAKITIFATMVIFGAVNLLRMEPRLAAPAAARSPAPWTVAVGHLRQNAVIEAGLGLIVLCIVGLLGILPPGLHTEPGWPLPFRFELGMLAAPSKIALAILAVLAAAGLVAAVATGAAGRYRRMMIAWCGFAASLGLGWVVVRPATMPAYPTSFYAPAEAYGAVSVARGARLYAANCALCHGADGRGNGPAAAGLMVRPTDLVASHLFAHTPGDLFWWVSHGRGNGVMPGFAAVMSLSRRWDVINFVRARAAGVQSQRLGPRISTAATAPVPDFAFEADGRQQTLDRVLRAGPVLLALFSEPPSPARLAPLAAAQKKVGARLRIIAVDVAADPAPGAAVASAPLVGVTPDVKATLTLFCAPGAPRDGGETVLLLDRGGAPRARWTLGPSGGLADVATLEADAAEAARFAAAPASHARHAH
jgi:copper resistance protein D